MQLAAKFYTGVTPKACHKRHAAAARLSVHFRYLKAKAHLWTPPLSAADQSKKADRPKPVTGPINRLLDALVCGCKGVIRQAPPVYHKLRPLSSALALPKPV